MKIICNSRCLTSHLTGVQRYTHNILKHFPENEVENMYPSNYFSRGIKGHIWEQLILPNKISKEKILWSPSNSGPISMHNQVLTLHDIAEIDHPEWHNKWFTNWYKLILPPLTKNCRKIITISNFTKERLIDRLKVDEKKIEVIYNGVDEKFYNEEEEVYEKIPFKNYILVLGSLEPRKNLPLLLKAWENVMDRVDESIGLVVVGAMGSSKVFGDVSINKDQKRVYFTGHLEDQYVISVYKRALFFCYLSFYEGFGLPPLEAMAAGCPIITSNHQAIREVVGDSGILVDPYSLYEIENGIISLANSLKLRKELIQKGLTRSKLFSWKNASNETWKCLQNSI